DGSVGNAEYRISKPLRFELVQHIGIFFEEKLYTQALNLLFNTLASGSYASTECITPLTPHLAIAVTFLVHPATTTRASSSEEKEVAHIALRLLRLLGTLVSPREARLDIAFAFTHDQTLRSGGRYRGDVNDNEDQVPKEHKPLNIKLGREGSLWSRAEDFWHAVGWTFNCSVLHPERWERWQIWLEFMCDVLQDDWNERERILNNTPPDTEITTNKTPLRNSGKQSTLKRYQDGPLILRESLLFQYISAGTGHGKYRRIIRSIFADGSSTAVNEFRQVFPKELKQARSDRKAEKVKKRERDVDIDKEEYGDYLAQDESDDDATAGAELDNDNSQSTSPSAAGARRSKRTRRGTRNAKDPSDNEHISETAGLDPALALHDVGVSPLGGLGSLDLRKRLLGLLSKVSYQLPTAFMPALDLYHNFIEHIRHMPFPVFQAFISPYILPGLVEKSQKEQRPTGDEKGTHGQTADAEQTTLCELLLFNMLESAAPQTEQEYLDQDKLEQCFLPFAAANASVVDNAKVSILLEALIVLLAGNGMLKMRPSLEEALQTGIQNRVERATDEIRRSQAKKQKESLEWSWLMESGDRLLFLMEVLQPQSQEH
ncbi:hypothetical protein N7450_008649, partial [Penicillium hetheringtonii]